MSEYQYYEFRATDRPLTDQEMASLRAISSRAHITSASFVNVYNYGDFRGDPEALMEKVFDAFLYVANWGTHSLMLRLPKRTLGSRECAPFRAGESLRVWCKGEHTILCLSVHEAETGWEEGEGWIDSLLPIRAELLRGDLRALYLGWLVGVQSEDVDGDVPEPPVPAGLRDLSPALRSLVQFLDIDTDLLEAAAELSVDQELAAPPSEMLSSWIATLPEQEKNGLLFRIASGKDPHIGIDLIRRFQKECPDAAVTVSPGSRTAGELLAEADRLAEERTRRDEERKRMEQEREAQHRAAERAQYLDALEAREAQSWDEVNTLVATKRQKEYLSAVTLLTDLRDLANRKGSPAIFQERLRSLCTLHASKPSFMRRLKDAGLEL
ncbi:MAG: hypothetical protein ABSC05_27065 [Candidatus Solibacter sp.]|jgi:hypothetical protein